MTFASARIKRHVNGTHWGVWCQPQDGLLCCSACTAVRNDRIERARLRNRPRPLAEGGSRTANTALKRVSEWASEETQREIELRALVKVTQPCHHVCMLH